MDCIFVNGEPVFFKLIALMHVYVTQANFTTKPRFEIKNKQKILFTNEACWWNLLVWRNHA